MKNYILTIIILLSINVFSQSTELPIVYVNKDITTHFISTQKIDYSDLSSKNIAGDKPMSNVLRIKPTAVSGEFGVITIVGEGYFVQYQLKYTPLAGQADTKVKVNEKFKFNNPNYAITSDKIKVIAEKMIAKKPRIKSVKSKKYDLQFALNNIWVVDDLFFVDYTALNKTNIKYDVDQIRYKIIDKKQSKLESNQDIEMKPIFIYDNGKTFKNKYRNIAVFKKFTYPDDKTFQIELAEEEYSGRTSFINIPYNDFLKARTF